MAAAPPTLRLRPSLFSSRLSPPYFCPPLIPPPPYQLVRAQTFAFVPLRRCPITLNQFFSDPPRRRPPLSAASSDSVHPVDKKKRNFPLQGSKFHEWDSISAKFAGAANVPFLLLQLPQIVLNARNLISGNNAALFAVPWAGMLTGLLGNLSLLSYFAKKKETEAVVVQTLGVVSTYAVIAQLAMAEAMPLPKFLATSAVVAYGLILNCLNYFGWLDEAIWGLWEACITVGGLSILVQVMWLTFVPFVPNSVLPGLVSFTLAAAIVTMVYWLSLGNLSSGLGKSILHVLLGMSMGWGRAGRGVLPPTPSPWAVGPPSAWVQHLDPHIDGGGYEAGMGSALPVSFP
ncbi:hypothetical protein BHM03_00006199 [Ensete ventricosum]|uniref:Maltose excess protein 1-like, chloroplastic n=1 Tax=Ensete ventricosum TaxID=4639 RepID=A0A445MBJ9_ENSVE|nr:hypothetical protein BHM03_00006199 [Ensete ventricosum]